MVEFLSLNTSVEAIDKLEKTKETLIQEMKQLNKDVTGSVKASNSAGDKQDELKKTVEAIRKRVEKLEK